MSKSNTDILKQIESMKLPVMNNYTKGKMHEAVGYNAALKDVSKLIVDTANELNPKSDYGFYKVYIVSEILTKFRKFRRVSKPVVVYTTADVIEELNRTEYDQVLKKFEEVIHGIDDFIGANVTYSFFRNRPYITLKDSWNEPLKIKEKEFVQARKYLDYEKVEHVTFEFLKHNASVRDVLQYIQDLTNNQ